MPTTYKGYAISYDPKPIPLRGADYNFAHDSYDGGDEDYDTPSRDRRCGTAASVADAMRAIDEIEADREDDATSTRLRLEHDAAYWPGAHPDGWQPDECPLCAAFDARRGA